MTNYSSTPPTGEPEKDPAAELQNELREMGRQLEAAFRTTLESDKAKRVQADLTAGVREITKQVRIAVENAQTNPQVQEVEQRGREVIKQASENKLVQDVQDMVLTGVAQLNVQLRKLVERMEAEVEQARSHTQSHQVPIDHEPDTGASTGETTRLNDQ